MASSNAKGGEMKTYKIHEIFYSLQGEGTWTGKAMVFVRFWGCNKKCEFCDTPQNEGDYVELSAGDICARIESLAPYLPCVCLTGGEPLLQVDDELLDRIGCVAFRIHLETNGSIPLSFKFSTAFNWIAVSPKDDEIDTRYANELRFVYTKEREQWINDFLLSHSIPKDVYISSMNSRMEINNQNESDAIDYCLKHPNVRLSTQMHKVWRIR